MPHVHPNWLRAPLSESVQPPPHTAARSGHAGVAVADAVGPTVGYVMHVSDAVHPTTTPVEAVLQLRAQRFSSTGESRHCCELTGHWGLQISPTAQSESVAQLEAGSRPVSFHNGYREKLSVKNDGGCRPNVCIAVTFSPPAMVARLALSEAIFV